MENFNEKITQYICSGHALLRVDTFEKDRAIASIEEVAQSIDRKIYIWTVARGWVDKNQVSVCDLKPEAAVEKHLEAIMKFDNDIILILNDFGGYLKHETYPTYDVVISWLDQLRKIVSSVNQTIIFVGPDFDTPKPLLHDITRIEFDLPDSDQIKDRIEFVCSGVEKSDGSVGFEINGEIVPQIVDACRGMTSQQTTDRVALALRKHKDLDEGAVQTIVDEKAGIIRASELLTYIEPPDGGLDNVGGYDALKEHILLDKPCFTQEARDYGIEFPRGILLVGIPGCGKTLLSVAIASELGLPLIAMDVGNLMNKFVGESEKNMREAIRMMESIAPCVLQLDEVEKGFGGVGDNDGGSSKRLFGTFLKWLSDRKSPVYAIATANQVQSLPPEFCRKGRFDEIFGLDVPRDTEREEIFRIHLSQRNRNPDNYDIVRIAGLTDGYTGADIEQIIKLALKMSFASETELSGKHISKAISEIVPLSKTEATRIETIREWCKLHAKPANPHVEKKSKEEKRKVVLG